MSLEQHLNDLRPSFVAEVQMVYDSWEQNDDGFDDAYGYGGVCDFIADRIIGVVSEHLDVVADTIGWDGDDHAFVGVSDGQDAFCIDIPANVYETGGGYVWRKLPGIVFTPDDVVIEPIPIECIGGSYADT